MVLVERPFLPCPSCFVSVVRGGVTVKLNASGLEVFRIDRFGVDGIGLYDFGLITCRSNPLRETATLLEIVAL